MSPVGPTRPDVATSGSASPTEELAQRVLNEPQHGSDYLYPPTASGQPLALAGFGLALAMLSVINAEWVTRDSLGFVVAAAWSFGSVAMIVAGIWDFRANNLFGSMWAIAYGCFWISIGLVLQFVGPQVTTAAGPAGFGDAFGTYLVLWGIFTAYMMVCAYFIARPAFIAFFLTAVVFVVVGAAYISSPGDLSDSLLNVGGYVGIADAAVAWYLSAALVINSTAGRQLLRFWPYPYK